MKISADSTRRALRTAYQGIVTLTLAAPILLLVLPQGTPAYAVAVSTVGALALVAKALNALEDAQLIPAWMKAPAVAADPQAGSSV